MGMASDRGSSSNAAGNMDALLLRLDAEGNVVWRRTFGRRGLHESFRAGAPAAGGGLVLLGVATGTAFGRGDTSSRTFLTKVNADGKPRDYSRPRPPPPGRDELPLLARRPRQEHVRSRPRFRVGRQ
jgi:hypothetical protein